MKICIAGKNMIAVNCLRFLIMDLYIDINNLLVCTTKSDNGVNGWQPSLLAFAQKNGVELVDLGELYNISNLFFFSLQFDRIIKPKKFKTNKLYNIHFSPLPKYKGMYTSVLPILFGEKKTGVTLHQIDKGIDTGNIIDALEFDIDINDTARDLYLKYSDYGFKLFKKNIKRILEGRHPSIQQPALDSTYYSRDSIDFNNIKIDLNKTSFQIHNQIRAFIFKEYQLPIIKGSKIKKSILTTDKIKRNFIKDMGEKIILSGIDGYKIILEKEND